MGPRPSVAWWVRAAGAGRIRYPLLRRWRAEAGASPGPTTHDGQWLSAQEDCGRVARVWVVLARAPKGAAGGILEIPVRAAAIPATQRAVRRPAPHQGGRGTAWRRRSRACGSARAPPRRRGESPPLAQGNIARLTELRLTRHREFVDHRCIYGSRTNEARGPRGPGRRMPFGHTK
jgi:hypothetical protein